MSCQRFLAANTTSLNTAAYIRFATNLRKFRSPKSHLHLQYSQKFKFKLKNAPLALPLYKATIDRGQARLNVVQQQQQQQQGV
jgi:hypothetical protein